MFKLESINQNKSTKVSFSINFTELKEEQEQVWQYYEIELHNGDEQYFFKSKDKITTSAVGTKAQIGKFAFAIKPHNEVEALTEALNKYISSDNKSFRFEPSDPSFELIIERLPEIADEANFKVYFWVDAGNTKELEYTWDSIGVRFICSKESLKKFSF